VAVEPRLFELLELAMQLYRETGGAYDVTAGPLWEAWGFARRAGAVPTAAVLAEARSRVGGHLVELDSRRRTVRFLQPGVRINLGSIGKGYAVDRAAERLLEGGLRDFLIHAGHSSVLARGSRTGAGKGDRHLLPERPEGCFAQKVPVPFSPCEAPAGTSHGWTVGLRDPLRLDYRLGRLRLLDRALGTSGAQFQSFRHQGRRYGHILDPRTGWPAEGVLLATVLAPSAAWADGLSTAFYVLGLDWARAYCQEHAQIAAVLICPAPGPKGLEIHTLGQVPLEEGLGIGD
jgi:thiamine biosynthesis lipoprotein